MAVRTQELEYINRTEEDFSIPSVVICCGGMGYYMGNAFKRRLVEYYPDGLKRIEFVYLDTDLPTTRVRNYIGGRIQLSADLWDIWNNPDRYPQISSWFSRSVIANPKYVEDLLKELGKTKFGAGACRPFGRCSIFGKAVDAMQAIERAVDKVWDQSGDMNFFVLSSLGGGTGTGIFMDVAAILRWIRKNKFSQSPEERVWEIFGILVGPGLLIKDEDEGHEITPNAASVFRANAYAALKELNHFLHGNPFSADYPGLGQVDISNQDQYDRLFNFVFLVDKTNLEDGKFSTKLDLGEMVGDFLFFFHFTDVGRDFFSRFPNIRAVDQAFLQEYGGQRTLFSTFGTATVEFPVNRLLEWCVLRKAAEVAGEFLRADRHSEADVLLDGDVGHQGKLEEFGLKKDRIKRDIIDNLLPEEPVILDRLDQSARSMLEGLSSRMTHSMSELITQGNAKGELYGWIDELLDDLPLATAVLKGLKERVEGMIQEVTVDMRQGNDYLREHEFYTEVEEDLNRLKSSFFYRTIPFLYKLLHGRFRRYEADLREAHDTLRDMILDYGAGQLCLSFLREIERELDNIEAREISPLRRVFERAAEELKRRMGDEEDKLRDGKLLSIYRIKTNSDFLEFFYERFSSEVDTQMLVRELSEARPDGSPFVRWARGRTPDEVGEFIREKIWERVKVEEVLGEQLTGVGKLWEIDFADIRDDKNPYGVFISKVGGAGRDDFDEIEEELKKRAAPALRYDEAKVQVVPISRLINRLRDEDIDPQRWWSEKLKAFSFSCLRGRYHNKVTLVNLRFGIPLAVLEFIDDWKEQYEIQKTKGHPLHLFPGAEDFPEPYF